MASSRNRTTEALFAQHPCGVGDFFVASWGYDQTNVDFYKVVGLTPKGVKLQKWSSRCVRDDGPQTYVVPGDSPATYRDWSACTPEMDYRQRLEAMVERDEPIKTKRLSFGYEGRPRVAWESFADLYAWDGKPMYETGSGWGH